MRRGLLCILVDRLRDLQRGGGGAPGDRRGPAACYSAALMKIAILGSGGVGGYYGARLARAGHDVTFIARGAHLAAIRERGLEVRSPALGGFVVRAAAEDDTSKVGKVDLVILAVKAYDNQAPFR